MCGVNSTSLIHTTFDMGMRTSSYSGRIAIFRSVESRWMRSSERIDAGSGAETIVWRTPACWSVRRSAWSIAGVLSCESFSSTDT